MFISTSWFSVECIDFYESKGDSGGRANTKDTISSVVPQIHLRKKCVCIYIYICFGVPKKQ